MKYLIAFLIIPTVQILFILAVLLGALYFGMETLLNRITRKRISN